MALPAYNTFLTATILLLSSTACSTLPAAAQPYGNFSAYAEAVFRHHNELISRLMMLSDGDEEDNDGLENAEQSMNDACRLLNEYAERESNGDSMGIFFKQKVRDSIENCDLKIQAVENMLVKLNKSPKPPEAID